MRLIDRARGMLLRPRQEWQVIDREQTTTADLYLLYVAPLATIGPVAGAIGSLVFARNASIGAVIGQAVGGVIFSLIFVYLIAVVIDQLAPTFGGTQSLSQALKVSAYGATAAFVSGIFSLVPALGVLGILGGLYSVYQVFTGLPILMKSPPPRAAAYTAVIVVVVIAITAILSIRI